MFYYTTPTVECNHFTDVLTVHTSNVGFFDQTLT